MLWCYVYVRGAVNVKGPDVFYLSLPPIPVYHTYDTIVRRLANTQSILLSRMLLSYIYDNNSSASTPPSTITYPPPPTSYIQYLLPIPFFFHRFTTEHMHVVLHPCSNAFPPHDVYTLHGTNNKFLPDHPVGFSPSHSTNIGTNPDTPSPSLLSLTLTPFILIG